MKKLTKFWPALVLVLVFVLACPPFQDIAEGKSKPKQQATELPCTNGDCIPTEPPCTNGDCTPTEPADKIGICHYPPGNPDNYHTIWINEKALESHLAHGDDAMPCEEEIDPNLCDITVQMCVPIELAPGESETMDISVCDVEFYRYELSAEDGPCECCD